MKKIKFLVLFLLFFNKQIFSFFEDIYNLKGSARSVATSASLSNDDAIAGITTNPTNILSQKNILSFFYSSMLEGLSNSSLSFVYKLSEKNNLFRKTKLKNFGISIFYNNIEFTNSTQLEFNDINQNGIKDIDEEVIYDKTKIKKDLNTNIALCLATVSNFEKFLLGFGLKYFYSKIASYTSSFATLDTAVKLILSNSFKISCKINNLLSTSNKENYPLNFEVGGIYSYNITPLLLLNINLDYATIKDNVISLGGEITYNKKYSLRCGVSKLSYNKISTNSFSTGFGLILESGVLIDYAFKVLQEIQENMHFVSLSYRF